MRTTDLGLGDQMHRHQQSWSTNSSAGVLDEEACMKPAWDGLCRSHLGNSNRNWERGTDHCVKPKQITKERGHKAGRRGQRRNGNINSTEVRVSCYWFHEMQKHLQACWPEVEFQSYWLETSPDLCQQNKYHIPWFLTMERCQSHNFSKSLKCASTQAGPEREKQQIPTELFNL